MSGSQLVFYISLVCLLIWDLMSHQHLRLYGDGTSVNCLILQTEKAWDQTCDHWFTRQVKQPLHKGGFLKILFWYIK